MKNSDVVHARKETMIGILPIAIDSGSKLYARKETMSPLSTVEAEGVGNGIDALVGPYDWIHAKDKPWSVKGAVDYPFDWIHAGAKPEHISNGGEHDLQAKHAGEIIQPYDAAPKNYGGTDEYRC